MLEKGSKPQLYVPVFYWQELHSHPVSQAVARGQVEIAIYHGIFWKYGLGLI